jgi:hypothetical protein
VTLAATIQRARRGPLVNTPERSGGDLREAVYLDPGAWSSDPQWYPDPAETETGCVNWTRGWRIELANGDRVRARCKATNRCGHCAMLSAYENAMCLTVDAELARRPTLICTFTTWKPLTDREFTDAQAVFWRAFRREWGPVEFCLFIEWTSGKAATSGGIRRLHAHGLMKDFCVEWYSAEISPGEWATLDPEERDGVLEGWFRRQWQSLVGAQVVEVARLRTVAGATAYLGLHFQKRSQQPPRGWTGKRFRPSRGYFNRPIAETRAEAALRLAEARAAARGDDPSSVRAAQLEALKPRLVPHFEDDGRPIVRDRAECRYWDKNATRTPIEVYRERAGSALTIEDEARRAQRQLAARRRAEWRALEPDVRDVLRALSELTKQPAKREPAGVVGSDGLPDRTSFEGTRE